MSRNFNTASFTMRAAVIEAELGSYSLSQFAAPQRSTVMRSFEYAKNSAPQPAGRALLCLRRRRQSGAPVLRQVFVPLIRRRQQRSNFFFLAVQFRRPPFWSLVCVGREHPLDHTGTRAFACVYVSYVTQDLRRVLWGHLAHGRHSNVDCKPRSSFLSRRSRGAYL
ncbi:hypothetical protein [Nocardia cerradoensis]|uniref:hypothetical protein n=1 Tax=Nocardia cerradoensis TaxID=85688 RepID=UPI00117D6857|nr:hypothetical protein [Nocardia cerradoensis]